jgi:hypothetical protein
MEGTMRSILAILLLQAAMLTAMPASAEPLPTEHVDRTEIRLVRVPILLESKSDDGCQGIDADEIEIIEDGIPIRATHIESKRLSAIHAILIDTGWDMLDYLQASRRAAAAYSGSLPAGEAMLLTTADDDLILKSPLSTDHQLFKENLKWIETGTESRFWDSLNLLIRVLRSRPERKVLIVLTDGCDTAQAGTVDPADVIDLAATAESLIVFPIGLNVPLHCQGQNEAPLKQLSALAQRTGGDFLELKSG